MIVTRKPDEWAGTRTQVFALYKPLGIDEHNRHRFQQNITGVHSLRSMSDQQHQRLLDVLTYLSSLSEEEAAHKVERILTGDVGAIVLPTKHEPRRAELEHSRTTVTLQDGDEGKTVSVHIENDIELLVWDDADIEATVRLDYKDGHTRLMVWGRGDTEPQVTYLLSAD